MDVSTAQPDASFSSGQVSQFVNAFGDQFDVSPGSGGGDNSTQGSKNPDQGADPRTKGKGLKKGLFKSPSEPE